MTSAISELLDFFNGKKPCSELAQIVAVLGLKNVRVISMNLFGWLTLQSRFGLEKPLELNQQYTWCQELPRMLEQWPALNALFIVDSGRCNFRESVSLDQRSQIRSEVMERYHPPLRR